MRLPSGSDEGEQIVVTRNCWACGWAEERSVSIDSIESTTGDALTVERATLVDEIIDELATIDTLAPLEDALAAIRRQRRHDSATTDTDDDSRRD